MFLRYPHRTHQARPSGSLILSGTQKKDMTCPGSIPMWSSSSFPGYSSTKNTRCPCSTRIRTPAVTPRALGLGALGCRTWGSLGWVARKPFCASWKSDSARVTHSSSQWLPLALLLPLNRINEVFSFQPLVHLRSCDKIWNPPAVGLGACLEERVIGFIPFFPEPWVCWELDLK